jgi:hypothetical protein
MKKYIIISNVQQVFVFLVLTLTVSTACKSSNKKHAEEKKDTTEHIKLPPPPGADPGWVDTPKIKLAIDTNLSFKHGGFNCDSAVFLRYQGSSGEYSFSPINEKGQWISTITKRIRLTNRQSAKLTTILGDKETFKNPLNLVTAGPGIGIVYFKKGFVIAKLDISMGSSGIWATPRLGNNNYNCQFNDEANAKLREIFKQME